jgi:hypothetical protein
MRLSVSTYRLRLAETRSLKIHGPRWRQMRRRLTRFAKMPCLAAYASADVKM